LFSESARLPKMCTKHPKSTHLSVPLGGAGIYIYVNHCVSISYMYIYKFTNYVCMYNIHTCIYIYYKVYIYIHQNHKSGFCQSFTISFIAFETE
jgi:hypothetical protein